MKFNKKKILKRIGIGILTIFILIFTLIFSLQLPPVQNFIKDKLIVYLEDKIKTKVELERVSIDFPNSLVMENLYLQGQDVDTLLYAKKLDVGLNIFGLIKSKADLTSIQLDTAKANITRKKDGSFNFDYIINAFASKEEESTPSKPFIISLDKIKLNNINVNFDDQQSNNTINVVIGAFDTRVKKFDLAENSYAIDKIMLNGLKLKLKQDLMQEIVNKVDDKVDSLNQTKPMKIELGEIDLGNFDVDYGDENSGMFAKLKFIKFNTHIKKLDLTNNEFAVGDIFLNGLNLDFNQKLVQDLSLTSNKIENPNSTSTPLKIKLNKINLSDIFIKYGDDKSKTYALVDLETLQTKINTIDLATYTFNIEDILLKNSKIEAKLNLSSTQNSPESTTTPSQPLSFNLNNAMLENVAIKYDNTAESTTQEGMDFNHLNFSKINVDLRDFKMENNQFSGVINNAEIKENRGLNIQKFETEFLYANNEAYLKNLYLKTPKTLIRDEIKLNYSSINELMKNPGSATINANIKHSKIGFADILNIIPTLKNTTPFNKYPNEIIEINTNLKGKINDLTINQLQVKGFDDLNISASGKIKNAMNLDKIYYDIDLQKFSTSSKTIYNLLPKNTIPNNIRIPSKLTLHGNAKGNFEVIDTDLNLKSTLGDATLNAAIDMRKKDAEKYKLIADVAKLDVGTFIGNDQIGRISGLININGQSFSLTKANTQVKADIKQVEFNRYNYQNLDLNATINQGKFDAHLTSKDNNANLDLVASGYYKTELSDVVLTGNIEKIDLNKLGFYENPLVIAGQIDAQFKDLDVDNINGNLFLKDFAIADDKGVLPISVVSLSAISTPDSNQFNLNSQVADAQIKGKFKPTQIVNALSETVNQYYQFQKKSTTAKLEPHQYFTLNATVKDDDLIRKFVPDLKRFETITLQADFDSDTKKLNLEGEIPSLVYGENQIENGKIFVNNSDKKLNYDLNINSLSNESFKLNKIDINGDVENNTINLNASIKDEKDNTQFLVAAVVNNLNEQTKISLKPNGLILNHDQWTVSENNSILIGSNGFVANNFNISKGSSEIAVNSETENPASPLIISIKNFKIETIAELVKKDDLPASGSINGTAQIRDLSSNMSFNADINITDLKAFEQKVGNLNAKIWNSTTELYNADVQLQGNNDLKLTGDYNTKASSFNLDLNINRLEMATIQGFSRNMIQDTEGFLSGNIDVNGTLNEPKIVGEIAFNQVGLTVQETGTNLRNINDKILLTSNGIEFNRFKINDNEGNSLTLNGDVYTKNYQDFDFDLTANGRDFRVVNSEESADALTYGVLAVNANLLIKGNLDLPKVSGTLSVTDQTNFTFVLPQTNPSLQERDGIVEFIDQDKIALTETIIEKDLLAETQIKGFDVSVNIEVDKDAKTSIVIDKANGDFVELQGEAELTGGMDPSGKISLTGVYQVEKGAYEMSVSLLKRRFDIQKGSTITWTGEPTTATLDITAIYTANAAPIDLIEQQLTGLSTSETNMYKQRMPFNTNLILKGELMKPEISFDITLNEDNPSIPTTVLDNTKAKLEQLRNDEAEMNKQVISLLLLNRFIGENPFQSQSGISAETMALQSVSNIVSQQLNSLAADLIEGVDIDFGLNTDDDYSTGQKNTRTDLNVAVSKRLLDDRLKVSIGSNFGLEGDARENENMTNIAGDITLDYNLSRDGRYMVRAYRKNEYQVALQGQIIETGVGFIITLDYDKFKEIFEKKRRNRNQKRIESKQ